MTFGPIDTAFFVGYLVIIAGIGLWVSRDRMGVGKTASEYFLADRALPWWVIGSSLIASNISSEQFIGMSGSGFAIGLGIAAYEWLASPMLIVIAKYFMPIYLKKQIYTMPEFLEKRYDRRVRTSLAVFWLLLYIFVNLTSVLYLGGLCIKTLFGINLEHAIYALALFSTLYSIYGGLMAVAWTDVVQVIFLTGGGLLTTYFAVDAVGHNQGLIVGFQELMRIAPEKFRMVLPSTDPNYKDLPGIKVIIGGLWVLGFSYWGCNQYITQRTLAAKSLKESQRGVLFAAYLKLLMPLVVVLPGIAAFALRADIGKPDEAYPWLLRNIVPTGVKGVAFAALVAAIVSSLSSMANSTATIFTMDIYREYIAPGSDDRNNVRVGRLAAVGAMVIATLIAPTLRNLEQAFQFIQEFSGFVQPAIFALFFFGMFWSRTTTNAVFSAALVSLPLSAAFKYGFPDMPFLDRIVLVFIALSAIIIVMSLWESKGKDHKQIEMSRKEFRTDPLFNIGAIGSLILLATLYVIFW
jgi:solute:Na+ symporter, SSS family